VIEDAGAKAIATSSAGVAWALGYPDGDILPPKCSPTSPARITVAITVPLSVDIEGGYSKIFANLRIIMQVPWHQH